ncbi:uncharacterized protein LOC131938999 [Physella acuta]|uniref:uncharacterized protein LOC131938999 n=1 Tax=Physella acuta TaxID=109671 RepID=UPI0027DD7120|nr:uncharacterized protein LOC131938999 [Physella acuta]
MEASPKDTPSIFLNRKLRRKLAREFIRRFCSGFSGGILLFAGVRIVTALLRNPFRESLPKIWQGILSEECARVATFFGLYPSLYHLLVDVLSVWRKNDGWNFGISGGLAGLSVAILDKTKRQTLAFFTLSRALGAGLSTLVARGVITAIPFFEVMVFCLCTSIIVYCVALRPQYLNTGYYRSILKWSRDYTDKNLQIMFRVPGTRYITCDEGGLHEGSCVQHRLKDLLKSLPGFAKLYLPIHVTPIVIFKRKVVAERPLYVLKSLVKNMILSTTFLGLTVALAKITICVLRNGLHQPPPLAGFIPALGGFVCGIALLLERHSRRKELSLFVIPHTINILYIAIKRSKLGPGLRIPHGFTLLFALSMMSVMHAYEREPESLSLLINGLLKFFVGPRTRPVTKPLSQNNNIVS